MSYGLEQALTPATPLREQQQAHVAAILCRALYDRDDDLRVCMRVNLYAASSYCCVYIQRPRSDLILLYMCPLPQGLAAKALAGDEFGARGAEIAQKIALELHRVLSC